jgi:hypothetical protein
VIDIDYPLISQFDEVDLLCSIPDGKVGELLEGTHFLLALRRDQSLLMRVHFQTILAEELKRFVSEHARHRA